MNVTLMNGLCKYTTNLTFDLTANDISTGAIYEAIIKVIKILSFIFYSVFLLLVYKFKELHNVHIVYLLNIDIIGFVTIGFYGFLTFSVECSHITARLCKLESILLYVCICLMGNGVVGLAVYRLLCVSCHNVKSMLTFPRIYVSLILIWLIPICSVTLPVIIFEIPFYYNEHVSGCRLNLTNHKGFMAFYFILSCGAPTVIILIIYVIIFWKLKISKNRVNHTVSAAPTPLYATQAHVEAHNQESSTSKHKTKLYDLVIMLVATRRKLKRNVSMNHHSIEIRLLIQLVVLFLTFEVYAVSNSILLFYTKPVEDTSNTNSISDNLEAIRLLRWAYHLLNPIIYLLLHPVIFCKVKSFC